MPNNLQPPSLEGHLPEVHAPSKEEVREGLIGNGLITIGESSPLGIEDKDLRDQAFPNITHHGYYSQNPDGFRLKEFFDGNQEYGVGNAYLGRGLYVGGPRVAQAYSAKLARTRAEGKPGVVEIIPVNANIIDLRRSNKKADNPVPQTLADALLDYCDLEMSKDRPDPRTGIPSDGLGRARVEFVNYARQLATAADLPTIRLLYTSNSDFIRDFLSEHVGVDGVMMDLNLSVGPRGKIDDVISFWRLDNIGDRQTWASREKKLAEVAKSTGGLINRGVITADFEPVDANDGPRTELENNLNVPKGQLDKNEAAMIMDLVDSSTPLLSAEQSEQMIRIFSSNLAPYEMTRQLSEVSPVLRRLLMSDVGVWEGYLLHEHNQASLGQFERNTRSNLLSVDISDKQNHGQYKMAFLMKSILNLQDIGKPLAVLQGSQHDQASYNSALASNLLMDTRLSGGAKQLITDVVGQDIFGTLIKSAVTTNGRPFKAEDIAGSDYERAAQDIVDIVTRNERFTQSERAVYQMLFMAHESDAAAYTSSARYRDSNGHINIGLPGLDNVFRHNPDLDRVLHAGEIHEATQHVLSPLVAAKLRMSRQSQTQS